MTETTNEELRRQIRAYEATVHNMQLRLDEAIAERDALRLDLEAVGAGGVQALSHQKPMATIVGQADAAIKNAAPQHFTPTEAQLAEYGIKASQMMARDQTRFDAACEVLKYLREQNASYYYMHRMLTVIHGNTEGTEAANAPEAPMAINAARWHWIANYLVGDRADLDDAIVGCETVDDLTAVVDAAMAAQKGSA
jgi:hypothetical protein